MKKIWILMILTVIGCCAAACPAQAAEGQEGTETAESTEASQSSQKSSKKTVKKGLVRENGHTRYYKKGELLRSTWKTVDGERYYFNAKGNAVTYGAKINDKWYVFSRKGRLLHPSSNRVMKVGSRRYYVSTKGRALSGWVL